MTTTKAAPLLHLLCDVARDAERTSQDGEAGGRTKGDQPTVVAPLKAKAANGAPKKSVPETVPKDVTERTSDSSISDRSGKKTGSRSTSSKERKRKRDNPPPTEVAEQIRVESSTGSSRDVVPESHHARRCADLEMALEESRSRIYRLQQDKMALQQRCAEFESLLSSFASGMHSHMGAAMPYAPQPFYTNGWDSRMVHIPQQGHYGEVYANGGVKRMDLNVDAYYPVREPE